MVRASTILWNLWLVLGTLAPCHADALYDAIQDNELAFVESYLRDGGDPNAVIVQTVEGGHPDAWRGTPLELAIRAKADDIAVRLLQAGADPAFAQEPLGFDTLLEAATLQGMARTVKYLIEANPLAMLEGDPRSSPLVIATSDQRADIVLDMLAASKRHGVPLGERLDVPLGHAAARGNDELASRLLDAGAAPREAGTLHGAVRNLRPDLVQAMLAAGADPTVRVFAWRVLDKAIERMEAEPGTEATEVLRSVLAVTPDPCQPLHERIPRPLSAGTLGALRELAPQCDWAALAASDSG